jgi:hypothetical protein
MKKIILLISIIASTTSLAQTDISGFDSLYKKVAGEAVGNEKGILVDRPSSNLEYSDINIIFDNEFNISSLALNRLDGRIELIATTGNNLGQLTGAYSSIRGDISIYLRMFEDDDGSLYTLNLVKNRKTIVAIFFE